MWEMKKKKKGRGNVGGQRDREEEKINEGNKKIKKEKRKTFEDRDREEEKINEGNIKPSETVERSED